MGIAIKSRHVFASAAGLGLCLAITDRRSQCQLAPQKAEKTRRVASSQSRSNAHLSQPSRHAAENATHPSWVRTARSALDRIQSVERALGHNLAGSPLAVAPTDKMTFEQLSALADDAEAFLRQRQNRWGRLEYTLKTFDDRQSALAPKPHSLGHAYRSAVAMQERFPLSMRLGDAVDTYFI